MAVSSLTRMSVPLASDQSASAQGLLMPKLKYRFRAIFENLGVWTPRKELTKQIISLGGKPSLDQTDQKLLIKNLSKQLDTLLVKSILNDEKRIIPCSVLLEGEYNQDDICIGVPCIIGKDGFEKIVNLDLDDQEMIKFAESASAVRKMNLAL